MPFERKDIISEHRVKTKYGRYIVKIICKPSPNAQGRDYVALVRAAFSNRTTAILRGESPSHALDRAVRDLNGDAS